jgi:hypothetical protein
MKGSGTSGSFVKSLPDAPAQFDFGKAAVAADIWSFCFSSSQSGESGHGAPGQQLSGRFWRSRRKAIFQVKTTLVSGGEDLSRVARQRLDYESFSTFLNSIKKLNAQQQTRERTLEEAKKLFGPLNMDLYTDFAALLNRHG